MIRKSLGLGKGKGYYNLKQTFAHDKRVHQMSGKGIKQPQNTFRFIRKKWDVETLREGFRQMADENRLFNYLWEKNKGKFYRGISDKPVGVAYMGEGIYLTWDKGMARAFADLSGTKGKVVEYKIPKDLKILDNQSKTFYEIKRKLGVSPQAKIGDPLFAKMLTYEVKKAGYDGVVSDEVADGLVIFDAKKAKGGKLKFNLQKVWNLNWEDEEKGIYDGLSFNSKQEALKHKKMVKEQERQKGGKLSLKKYLGKWNEIARTPTWFQQGCKKAIAEYSKKKGYIEVKNSCLRDGKRDFRYAKAYKVGDNKLEVDFVGGRIFTGDYNVLHVDKGYRNAVVGSGKYVWILSRNPKMSDAKLKQLKSIAEKKGYDTKEVKRS